MATTSRLIAIHRTQGGTRASQQEWPESEAEYAQKVSAECGFWSDEQVRFVAGPTSDRKTQSVRDFGPFHHDGVCLLWDGRLDNQADLAANLGMPYETVPKLIIGAYRRWDKSFAEHLVGDWALVLWDAARNRLVAAKDPLGWRPLYFAVSSDQLALASDFRDLWRVGFKPQLNEEFVYRYLVDATQDPGTTAYKDVSLLHGGQLLIASGSESSVETYWDAPRVSPRNYKNPCEYVEEFDELVSKAVGAMTADAKPTGVFLSGGLDSSYVASVAADLDSNIRAMSSYAPNTSWDEREYQKTVILHTGLASKAVDVSRCTALNPEITPPSVFDIPGTPPQHALLAYMGEAAAQEGWEVILSGVGGDEWLTGDPRFVADALLRGHPRRAVDLARHRRPSANMARFIARSTYRAVATPRVQALVGKARGKPMWDGMLPFVPRHEGWEGKTKRVNTTLLRPQRSQQRIWSAYRNDAQGNIEWMDRHCHRPYGIEFRSPLNDLRVIEFLAGVPEWVKRFDGRPKDIMRKAMQKRGLPGSLYERSDKASYDEPYELGLRLENRATVEQAIETVCRLPLVDQAAVRRETKSWLDDPSLPWEPTWRVVSTGLWLEVLDTLSPNEGMPLGAFTLSPRQFRSGDRSPLERGKEEK